VSVFSLDYDQFVGLYLNIPRVQSQWAAAAAQGTSWSRTPGPLPWAYFDAVVDDEEEVQLAMAHGNSERQLASLMARHGR